MDKQTAIDLLDNLLGMVEDNHESDYDTAIHMGIDALKSNAPNALSALDCVERKAAVDAIRAEDDYSSVAVALGLGKAITAICELPSAQREPLTDKEQRIFLAAMGREEKVCKQVDDEYRDCMEPYEDSLVRICHEITRKVKGALWT